MNTDNEFTGRKPRINIEEFFDSKGNLKFTRPLNKDEAKVWRECQNHGFWSVGLPSATIVTGVHIYTQYTRGGLANLLSSGLGKFVGTFIITCFSATTMYFPICFDRTFKLYSANLEKEEREKQQQHYADADVSEPGTEYQGSLDSKFDGPDSKFSHLNVDSSYSSDSYRGDSMLPENDRSKSDKLIPEVSYEELRRRNREKIYPKIPRPSNENRDNLAAKVEPPVEKVSPEPPSELPKRLKKNKYGDDIEF